MIKQCERCHADFDARTCAKYCPACRPIVHREQFARRAARWRVNHREQVREYARNHYHEVTKPRKVKEQKLKKLSERLKSVFAKRKPQPEPERHWTDEMTWTSPLYF